MARSKIKATAVSGVALHFILCMAFCKNAMLCPSTTSAFTATNSIIRSYHATTSCNILNSSAKNNEATTGGTTSVDDAAPPSPTTTKMIASSSFQIREAEYSDLAQAAELMTDGFYPELKNNPIMRPIRYLMELDRLQGNFPYEEDGRHFYLVAYYDEEGGKTTTRTTDDGNGKVIGFCDIDGRIPKAGGTKNGFSFSPFVTKVNRPQPYFSDLAVHPDHRRQGVASALMTEAERRATNMGFDELYLGVRSTNELALQMYSRIGYESIIPSGDMLAFLEIQKEVRMLRRSLDQFS